MTSHQKNRGSRWIIGLACLIASQCLFQSPVNAGLGVPKDSKPGRKRSGASRSPDGFKGFIMLLTPSLPDARKPSTFLTDRSDPTLYWYLSKGTDKNLMVSLHEYSEGRRPKQVGGKEFVGVMKGKKLAGVHALNLEKAFGKKVTLNANVKYDVRVSIVSGERPDANDPVSIGCIEFRPVSPEIKTALAAAKKNPADVLATHGYWFSSLEKLAGKEFASQRADLLEEGKLEVVAFSERLRLKPRDKQLRAQLEAALKQQNLIAKLPSPRIDLPE